MKSAPCFEKIRERILSTEYGKFDLVESILTKEEILNPKPRLVLQNIIERLSIPEDKINRKTFWSWLRRYKLSNKPAPFVHYPKSNIEFERRPPVEQAGQEWINNFNPSEPQGIEREPVVIKVIRSGNNF